jgi:hypothetical protein
MTDDDSSVTFHQITFFLIQSRPLFVVEELAQQKGDTHAHRRKDHAERVARQANDSALASSIQVPISLATRHHYLAAGAVKWRRTDDASEKRWGVPRCHFNIPKSSGSIHQGRQLGQEVAKGQCAESKTTTGGDSKILLCVRVRPSASHPSAPESNAVPESYPRDAQPSFVTGYRLSRFSSLEKRWV